MGLEASHMRRSCDSWHGLARKREGSGGSLIIFYRYLMERCVKDGDKLFLVVPNDKTRRWAQTETQEVPSEHKKATFLL